MVFRGVTRGAGFLCENQKNFEPAHTRVISLSLKMAQKVEESDQGTAHKCKYYW